MNTPSHVVVNLLACPRSRHQELWLAVVLGALAPDAPMLVFYIVARAVLGLGEAEIWSRAYFDPGWQNLFDSFNSLPFMAVGLFVARMRRSAWLTALFASMALHSVADLGVHHGDAHRYLFPFSDWRFRSPISYWDPAHHGRIFAPVEAAFTMLGAAFLALRGQARQVRIVGAVVVAATVAFAVYASILWRLPT